MTHDLQLYYDYKNKMYVYHGEPVCHKCHRPIEHNVFLHRGWSNNREPRFQEFCHKCFKEIDFNNQIDEVKIAFVSRHVPVSSFPVFESPPPIAMRSGNPETVFSVAGRSDGSQVNDKTILANRESIEGAKIGAIDHDKIKEENDLWQAQYSLIDEHKKLIASGKRLKLHQILDLKQRIHDLYNPPITDENHFDNLLDEIKNSKPVIGFEDKNKLVHEQ